MLKLSFLTKQSDTLNRFNCLSPCGEKGPIGTFESRLSKELSLVSLYKSSHPGQRTTFLAYDEQSPHTIS